MNNVTEILIKIVKEIYTGYISDQEMEYWQGRAIDCFVSTELIIEFITEVRSYYKNTERSIKIKNILKNV
jgi:hypothetical protein